MNKQQRIVLIVSILASFVAFLDGSVVNVALPAIARELGGGLVTQQWTVNAYLITLGALMLIAGSLSDLFGRKRILTYGLIGFAATSLLCAVAPNALFLIVARGLQGVAGALLVPSSLALIMAHFSGAKQGKAIGIWTAWTVIAAVVGPLLGGFLVDAASWRLIFAINIVPIAYTLWSMRKLPSVQHSSTRAHVDITGAILCALGLGSLTYTFIQQPYFGWASPFIYLPLALGIGTSIAFIWYERRAAHPMLPLHLFAIRNFGVGNIATAAIYGGLAVSGFLVTIFVQQIGGYSAVAAGFAFIPVTALMFLLSSFFGGLAGKYGPRLFMAVGPMVAAIGFLLMLRLGQHINYWVDLLPGVLLFGLGLTITVAPLTAAILGSIHPAQSGIGSAVNNAVARVAGLVAVAAVGIIVGTTMTVEGFHNGLLFTAALLFAGGIISAIGIENPKPAAS